MRELLILQSFYCCKSQSDIVNLVKIQPNPHFFFKTFLELGVSNMTTILAFDSRAIEVLLNPDNEIYFDDKSPIIYKMKMTKKNRVNKYYYNSAIDIALKNNQVKAGSLMLDYIVKYQNNFVSCYLFKSNFSKLIEMGLPLHDLLDSSVFTIHLNFDGWPDNHTDDSKMIKHYNGSYFHLRQSYSDIFPDLEPMDQSQENQKDQKKRKRKSNRVYKIKYTINMLPSLGEHIVIEKDPKTGKKQKKWINKDLSLLELFSYSEELEVFETDTVKDMIYFKWDTYCRRFHTVGCIMHLFNCVMVNIYVLEAYIIVEHQEQSKQFNAYLIAGMVYPTIYEIVQLFMLGMPYFDSGWNIIDILNILAMLLNIIF